MKKSKKILKNSLLALSSILLIRNASLNVNASNDKEKENKYRYEHQIEDNVELIDLSNKYLIKTESENKIKYYLCSMEEQYLDEKVTQENIHDLFQNTPAEDYLNSNKPKYIKKPIVTIKEYTDLTNSGNKFVIYEKSIDVYDGFPSSENKELICWGDIKTYSQTISNETYTEYRSFDVPTQQFLVQYENNPEMYISVCSNKEELLTEIWQDDYIIQEDLEYVVDLLNGEIPTYTRKKF